MLNVYEFTPLSASHETLLLIPELYHILPVLLVYTLPALNLIAEDGSEQKQHSIYTKRYPYGYLLFCEEELRNEAGGGTIVVISIRHIVRIELKLVIIEVQDRSLREHTIAIRKSTSIHLHHQNLKRHRSLLIPVFYLIACESHLF